jgi:hypothetical protein
VGRVHELRLGDCRRPLLFFRGSFRQLHEGPPLHSADPNSEALTAS